MDILQAALLLRPGTGWVVDMVDGVYSNLRQAEDGTPRVSVPTLQELQPVMDSDTTPAYILGAQRTAAIAQLITDSSPTAKALRGILLLAMNENNLIREWLMAFQAATAAATTLADLKTRVAGLSAMPDRTASQLKTAVTAIENAGTAD